MPSESNITHNLSPQPRQLRFDTTTQCNAHCASCHRFLSNRIGEMPPDMIIKILKDVARWDEPLKEIIPVNYGEFFLRQDWLWILQMIERYLPRTKIVLPTNGSLLDDKKIDELCQIQTIDIINFSINAYFDETYEAFMQLPASTMDKIRHTMERIRVLRADITLWSSIVFDPSYHTDAEREFFFGYWKDISYPQILTATSANRGLKLLRSPLIPCRSLFSDIVIGFDGKLSSCCFDSSFSLDLGEYSGDLLKDWHNPKLEAFRQLHNEHRRGEIELCRNCSFG